MTPGGQPQRSRCRIGADGRDAIEKIVPVNGGMTEAKLSPNGKEFAFVFRGEIFVSSIDGKIVKRITNTPWQERTRQLQPRRAVAGLRRREGQQLERLHGVADSRASEPYFFASTVLKDEAVVATAAEEFQPAFSPDGKEIAYLENRQTLKVYNIASKQSRTVLPARLQLFVRRRRPVLLRGRPTASGCWSSSRPASGCSRRRSASSPPTASRRVRNLTQSGYDDVTPKWAMDGKMMIWGTTREGALSQGGGAISGDVYGMYFTKAAYDRSKLSKEEFALVKEREDKDKKDAEEKAEDGRPSDQRPRPRQSRPASRSRSTGTA